MRLRMMAACCVTSACLMMTAHAQMGAPAPTVAPGTAVEPSKALDDLLKLFEDEVVGVAKAMPADKYSFTPVAGTFATGSPAKFDTVKSFSQQVTHTALANYYFYSAVGGMKPDVDMAALQKMTADPKVSKDDALKMLTGSLAFAHKAIAAITTANAFLAIKPIDGQNTRATLAAFGVAHGYDHYGQMVEYLRMNGIVPPGSK